MQPGLALDAGRGGYVAGPVGAQRDSMGEAVCPVLCLRASLQAGHRLRLVPTVPKNSGAYLPLNPKVERCVVGIEFCLAPHADM